MKRFLLFFCAAVLLCSIMILPAFAAEDLVFSIDHLNHQTAIELSAPLDGLYSVNFYDADNQVVLSLPAQDFTYPNQVYYGEGSDGEGDWWEMVFYYTDNVLMLETSFGGCSDEDCGTFSRFYPDVATFELVPASAPTPEPDPDPVSPVAGIFGVFTGVGSWLGGQLGATTSLFWNSQGLTFLGVLSVCALGLAVILLLIAVVVRFLQFGG